MNPRVARTATGSPRHSTLRRCRRACLFLVPPGGATIDAVRRVLDACDAELKRYNYFLFGFGSDEAWDPAFNARLLYEGFFTITARLLGAGTEPLPLPERSRTMVSSGRP